MKKTIIILSIISFISCKKEYKCECKGSVTIIEGNQQVYFKQYKKYYLLRETQNKAEKICKSKEVLDITDYYDSKHINISKCELN